MHDSRISRVCSHEASESDSRMGACPDTCGCRRTCPPKPRYAPPARRFASLKRGSARRDGARRFRFSHPAERRHGTMPFARKGDGRRSRSASTCASRRQRRSSSAGSPQMPGIAVAELVRRARPRSPRRVAHRRHDNPRAAPARRPPQEGSRRQRRRLQQGDGVRPRRASRGYRPARRRRRGAAVIVKKIGTSKTAAPKSKASNVRALVDYIAGVASAAATARRSSTAAPSTSSTSTTTVRYRR